MDYFLHQLRSPIRTDIDHYWRPTVKFGKREQSRRVGEIAHVNFLFFKNQCAIWTGYDDVNIHTLTCFSGSRASRFS